MELDGPVIIAGSGKSDLIQDFCVRGGKGMVALSLRRQFAAKGCLLERVESYKYLGRILSMDNNDIIAVHSQLAKARRDWARVSKVLRAQNAASRVCSHFYKAVVQGVLLFGSESWTLIPP